MNKPKPQPERKKEKLFCARCKKAIHGPRTVIKERWHCADCTYVIDHPDTELKPHKRQKKVPGDLQMFDDSSYERRDK